MPEPLPERVPPIPKPKAGSGKGLTKKIGPLPAWAWGAILVGGIAFVLYYRSKTGGKTAAVDTPATGTIFDQGGGAPAPPANGVPGSVVPCPAGYHNEGGLCVPDQDVFPLPGETPIPPGVTPFLPGPPAPVSATPAPDRGRTQLLKPAAPVAHPAKHVSKPKAPTPPLHHAKPAATPHKHAA